MEARDFIVLAMRPRVAGPSVRGLLREPSKCSLVRRGSGGRPSLEGGFGRSEPIGCHAVAVLPVGERLLRGSELIEQPGDVFASVGDEVGIYCRLGQQVVAWRGSIWRGDEQ